MGPATADFLSSLRVLLSLTGEAGTLSTGGHGGAGGGSAARAGFGPGEAPQDFERISALVELAQRGDA
jgi:RNA polymerase sigma-70 factor (ECF subfamily)